MGGVRLAVANYVHGEFESTVVGGIYNVRFGQDGQRIETLEPVPEVKLGEVEEFLKGRGYKPNFSIFSPQHRWTGSEGVEYKPPRSVLSPQ